MFERYTEEARRVIFFARYEASVLGAAAIDTEHLLLGWLREETPLCRQFLDRAGLSAAAARKSIEASVPAGPAMSTAVDIPLTRAARRVMQHANEEAGHAGVDYIGPEHLFLGLLGEPGTVAGDFLASHGLRLEQAREDVRLALPACAPATPRYLLFDKLVDLLRQLEDRRAPHHVSLFRGNAVRVEVALPEERWAVTFFADGHIGVDEFWLSSGSRDESALAALLERLGPKADG